MRNIPVRNLINSYKFYIILWCSTFFIVIPLLAQKWVFSPYFYASEEYKSYAHQIAGSLNTKRFNNAQKYLSTLNPKENKDLHSQALRQSIPRSIVAMVTTMKRIVDCEPNKRFNTNCEASYLQQTVATLDKEIKKYAQKGGEFIPIVICNVDLDWQTFQDFQMVEDKFPVICRHKVKPTPAGTSEKLNQDQQKRAKESSDYAFCLDALYNATNGGPNYALVFEDDALAFPDFFDNLFYILNSHVEKKLVRGEWMALPEWSYLKLYYPEKWAGFSLEFEKAAELFWIAIIGALVGTLSKLSTSGEHRKTRSILACGIFSALYAVVLSESISRQTLLETRRVSPFFLKVKPDRGCCTPSVIYQMKLLPRIVEYLESPSTADRRSEGVDLALDDFTKTRGLNSYVVEPSLIQHIGMYSSLTVRKDATQILFYDLLYGNNG